MTILSEIATQNFGDMNHGNNRTVFRNPRGRKRFYSFTSLAAVPASFAGQINYFWSEDQLIWTAGSTAPLSESADTDAVRGDFDVKIHDDGSQLEVFVVANFRNDADLKYRRGTIADGDDTITWGGSQQTIDSAINYENISGTYTEYQSVAIARTDNGRLVVAFSEDFNTMGKDYRLIKVIGSSTDGNTPSWSGETTVHDGSGSTNNQNKEGTYVGLEAFDSTFGDRVLLYGRTPDSVDNTSYGISAWVYSWGGVSMTQETSSVDFIDGGSTSTDVANLSVTIGSDDKVNFATAVSSQMNHDKFGTAGSVTGSTTQTQVDTGAGIFRGCTISKNTTTSELVLFWTDYSAIVDLFYAITDDTTISWSSIYPIPSNLLVNELNSSQEHQAGAIHLAFKV